MDLLLIGGGIFLLYWLGTSAGAQPPPSPGPISMISIPSGTSAAPTAHGTVLADVQRAAGLVSTAARIGRSLMPTPSGGSDVVQALVGPSTPADVISPGDLIPSAELGPGTLPTDLVDLTDFIPSAEQGLTTIADVVGAAAVEPIVSTAADVIAPLTISQVAGEPALASVTADVLSTVGTSIVSIAGGVLMIAGVVFGAFQAGVFKSSDWHDDIPTAQDSWRVAWQGIQGLFGGSLSAARAAWLKTPEDYLADSDIAILPELVQYSSAGNDVTQTPRMDAARLRATQLAIPYGALLSAFYLEGTITAASGSPWGSQTGLAWQMAWLPTLNADLPIAKAQWATSVAPTPSEGN
jgi:hypothetical protein